MGILFLPQGELSTVVDLSFKYQYFKKTEDHDMSPIDFITDHLININGWFDKHDNDDEQKPHLPMTVSYTNSTINYFICFIKLDFAVEQNGKRNFENKNDLKYHSDYNTKVFKPPMNC